MTRYSENIGKEIINSIRWINHYKQRITTLEERLQEANLFNRRSICTQLFVVRRQLEIHERWLRYIQRQIF